MTDRWADYWAGSGGRSGGCLPNAAGGARAALDRLWRDFARDLPAKARLLDLATGDGAVPRTIRAARRDLVLTGVDSAPALPPAPAGIRLQAGVAMERLPFADAAFDAVTSQFGIEYGDVARIAAEAARVLKVGGRLRAAVHHAAGAIVGHNLGRRDALGWAVGESGLLDRGRRLAAARAAAALPTPRSFRAAIEQARTSFPGQTAAAEFAAAVADTLDMGASRPPRETLEVLATLEARGRAEIARLDALAKAARDEEGIGRLADALGAAGLAVSPPRPLAESPSGGGVIAWVVDAARA